MVAFFKSLFLGRAGEYKVFGVPVHFVSGEADYKVIPSGPISDFIIRMGYQALKLKPVKIIGLAYLYTFSHEMGHALALRAFKGLPKVCIFEKDASGRTYHGSGIGDLSLEKRSVVNAAGSLSMAAMANCQLVGLAVLKSFVGGPAVATLAIGPIMNSITELFYIGFSAIAKDSGDFGVIARRSKTHLALALAAVASEYVLGFLGIRKFW